ncbi:hypothetical protein OG754_00625 [Streptomyces decoyicus]
MTVRSPLPRIVIHPPTPGGGRQVHVDATPLGVAYNVAELLELLRRVGLDPAQIGLNNPAITWRGGGPHVWSAEPR